MDQEEKEVIEFDTTSSSPEENTKAAPKKASQKTLLTGVGVAIVLGGIVLCGSAAYGVYHGSENKVVVAVATALHMPVAKVNGQSVLYSDYIRDLQSIRAFYTTHPPADKPYTKDEESDQVLSRLIASTLVQQSAKEFNVSVSDDDRTAAKKDILSRFDNDEKKLGDDLQKNLGVSLPEFYANIMEPTLLEKKLAETFSSSTDAKFLSYSQPQVKARHILFAVSSPDKDVSVKAQAQKVLDQIKKGSDFAAMAKKYGSDGTKDTGGDLGWFGQGEMVPEFDKVAFELKKGELSPVLVKTQFGYHIMQVEDTRTAKNFSTFMNERLKSATIHIFGSTHNPFPNVGATK